MTIQIRNVTSDFNNFWNRARDQPISVKKQLWHDLYENLNRDIFDIYFSRYGHRENLETALQRYEEVVDDIHSNVPQIRLLIEQTAPKCAHLFEQNEYELLFVLMVGVFNSDGWVVELDGQATTFMALEVDSNRKLSSVEILVAHEIAHCFHAQCSTLKQNTTTVGEGLILEGLAVLSSTLLVPDASEAAYLWPGGDKTITGQDCQEWVNECRNSQKYICEQLLKDFEQSDENRYASYFFSRLRTQRQGIPLRAGYVIGYDMVRTLYKKYTIAELARWSPERVMSETYQQLKQLTHTD